MSDEKVTRQSDCPKCLAPLRCCRQCRFFAPGKYGDCAENEADYNGEREAVNFCSYYRPAFTPTPVTGRLSESRADKAKKKFDDLFKD
jgi:hypothetical protein